MKTLDCQIIIAQVCSDCMKQSGPKLANRDYETLGTVKMPLPPELQNVKGIPSETRHTAYLNGTGWKCDKHRVRENPNNN